MAYVEPKIDWNEAYSPDPTDFNRIEGNTKQNHLDVESETTARENADSALDARITPIENYFTESITVGDTRGRLDNETYENASLSTYQTTSYQLVVPFDGNIRVKFTHYAKFNNGSSTVRVLKNGSILTFFSTTSSITRSYDSSVSAGDYFTLQHIYSGGTTSSIVENFGLYYNDTSNILFNIWGA